MALGDLWSRTLVYFGIAEEDDDWDEDGYVTNEELERSYAERERANVRRLQPRRRERDFDDWTDPGDQATAVVAPRRRRPLEAAPAAPSPSRVHLVVPRSFNDAQQIADK